MRTKRYALEPGGAERVELTWEGSFKNVVVKFDGRELGRFANRKQLKTGRNFPLPDRSSLRVQFVDNILKVVGLHLTRNGRPLPGSGTDPVTIVNTAAGILGLIAVLSFTLGLISLIFEPAWLTHIGMTPAGITEGLIFGVLAYLTKRRWLSALIMALILYAYDTFITFIILAQGNTNLAGVLVPRLFLAFPLIRGVMAFSALYRQASDSSSLAHGQAGIPPT